MSITQQPKSGQSELAESQLKVSKKLHPEDIAIGDNVAVSEVAFQYASFMWFGVDSTVLPPHEVVQLTYYPTDTNEPLIVKTICLPFVLCEQVDAQHVVLDLRRTQLVRLDPSFAHSVRKALKANESNSKSIKKSKKKKSKHKNRTK